MYKDDDLSYPFDLAMAYIECNLKIFPLSLWKKPFKGTRGFKDATLDKKVVTKWWKIHPMAMVGLPTGKTNNLVVLDIDCHSDGENGYDSLNKLTQEYAPLPETISVQTPSGGRHYYFKYPDDKSLGRYLSTLGTGLDLLADNGYVVAPYSCTPNGRYEPNGNGALDFDEIPLIPEWIISLCTEQTKQNPALNRQASFGGTHKKMSSVPISPDDITKDFYEGIELLKQDKKGTRNNHLFKLAIKGFRYAFYNYLSEDEVVERLVSAMTINGSVAESHKSVIGTINSAKKYIF